MMFDRSTKFLLLVPEERDGIINVNADFEKLLEESLEWQRKCDEAIKRIETQRAAMTPEERAGWDEADRAVFERWQDEANTNAILDGYEPEGGEDPDFNPFRKDLSL